MLEFLLAVASGGPSKQAMVQIGVPTCRMGPPPEPNGPIYPGVSAKKFDPASAVKVYGDQLKKEMSTRYAAQMLGNKLQFDPRGHNDEAVGDMLPGYRSILSTYERLGFTISPVGLPEPPKLPVIPKLAKPLKKTELSSSSQAHAKIAGRSSSVCAPTSISLNNPTSQLNGRRWSRRQLGAEGDADRGSDVHTTSSIWSLPPADLSKLSLNPPSSVAPRRSASTPALDDFHSERFLTLVKNQYDKKFTFC